MKGKILLIGLFVLAISISGCVYQKPLTNSEKQAYCISLLNDLPQTPYEFRDCALCCQKSFSDSSDLIADCENGCRDRQLELEAKWKREHYERCVNDFVSWCQNCLSLGWPKNSEFSPLMDPAEAICLNEYFKAEFYVDRTYCFDTKIFCESFEGMPS